MDITINQNTNFGTHNTSVRNGKIEYIVIHYVGATGDAKANINYYNQKTTTNASADFYVGHNGDIWQYNPDPEARYCWAVGGKKQSSYGGNLYGIAKNANCVSIEMCVKNSGDKSANSADWILSDATYNGTLLLTKYLMGKYSIDIDHVIRHYDVTAKACPGIIGWNTFPGNNESKWLQFKKDLTHKATLESAQQKLKEALKIVDGNATLQDAQDELKAALKITDTNTTTSTNHSGVTELPTSTSTTSKNDIVSLGQQHANNFVGSYHKITADGIRGTETMKQGIRVLQHAMNCDYKSGLTVDGIFGTKSNKALGSHYVKKGETQYMVTAAEILLMLKGYNPNGVENPGKFGSGLETCVKQYQKDNGLTVDGIVGSKTFLSLIS